MIQLNPDCLLFQMSNGEMIPCSAELVTLELIGDAVDLLDPELVRNASAAVLHYFKDELGRHQVSVMEFSTALEQVLRGFGLKVTSAGVHTTEPKSRVAEADLREIAVASGKGFELFFFTILRDELHKKLEQSPQVVRFLGLRGCVKQIVGARRWSDRCQAMSDQIVDFLRTCLNSDPAHRNCALVVQ